MKKVNELENNVAIIKRNRCNDKRQKENDGIVNDDEKENKYGNGEKLKL